MFIGVIASMAIPIVLKQFVDTMTQGADVVQVSEVLFFLIPLSVAFLVELIGWRLGVYAITFLEPKVMTSIAKECFASIHKHSFNFFNNEFVGSLVKRVNRMIYSIETFMDIIAFEMFTIVIRLVISITVLFWINPVFGAAMLIWATIFIVFNYLISIYKMKIYDLPRVKADTEVTGYLADTISNNVNIKLFSTRLYEGKGFSKVIGNWKKRMTASWLFSSHLEAIQNILMVALQMFMIYVAVKLWGEGSVTIGDFVLIQAYLMQVFVFIWNFGRHIRRLYESFANAEEMTVILNTPIEVKDVKDAKDLIVPRGKIEFKSVDFSYGKKEDVIKKLDLKVKPGERVALIGPSGGGKTTIVKMILRLFDIDKGEILVDSQNIAKVTQDSLRAQIASVPQDPILFHRSLMENIRYGRVDAPDEEVIAASKMANCHEFITAFPKGYETLVGERGVKLSGGERQRIAIARAILSNAKILILDEATSNLDVNSERLIQDALSHLTKNKTTIVIAHRLSTVMNVDRIIVLKNGKIIEEGGHNELMKSEDGLYKSLWDLSVRGYGKLKGC